MGAAAVLLVLVELMHVARCAAARVALQQVEQGARLPLRQLLKLEREWLLRAGYRRVAGVHDGLVLLESARARDQDEDLALTVRRVLERK
eukprot:7382542-Prymnesium_polylepis.1